MKKSLLFSGLALLLLPAAVFAQSVTPREHDAIEYVLDNDIMYNQFGGEFEPRMAVSRLEFTLAAVDVLAHDADFENCFRNIAPSQPVRFTLLFNDVKREEWYGKQLCMAIYEGFVSGDRNGNFRPFDSITVAEASKIMSRGYGLIYPAAHPTGKQWFETPMLALEMKGALSSKLQPHSYLTRADMAVMFHALRNQQRYPLTRIIGSRTKGVSVAAAVTDIVMPVQIAPLKKTARREGIPCGCLPPVTSADAIKGISITMKSANHSSIGMNRPSHRLLREQVLKGRTMQTPLTRAPSP